MPEPVYCEFQVYRATLEQPAEYCPNEAEPGQEYCLDHIPDDVLFPYEDDVDPWEFEYEGDYE